MRQRYQTETDSSEHMELPRIMAAQHGFRPP